MRIAASALVALVLAAPCAAQEEVKTDVSFNGTRTRMVIEAIAKANGKSVAFDVGVPNRPTALFKATNVTPTEALWRFLEREHLFSIEVAGAIVVAPDREPLRGVDYSPERVASLLVAGHRDDKRTDVIFRNTPLTMMLKPLAEAIGRKASFDEAITKDTRRYDLDLNNVTIAEALQIAMLVNHVRFREEGDTIAFEADVE